MSAYVCDCLKLRTLVIVNMNYLYKYRDWYPHHAGLQEVTEYCDVNLMIDSSLCRVGGPTLLHLALRGSDM